MPSVVPESATFRVNITTPGGGLQGSPVPVNGDGTFTASGSLTFAGPNVGMSVGLFMGETSVFADNVDLSRLPQWSASWQAATINQVTGNWVALVVTASVGTDEAGAAMTIQPVPRPPSPTPEELT
jgi:hypothetical protein